MAAETARLPVYVRIGDGPEYEAGTVEVEANDVGETPDLARVVAGAPYPLDFTSDVPHRRSKLTELAGEVRRASNHTTHEQLIRNLEAVARDLDVLAEETP